MTTTTDNNNNISRRAYLRGDRPHKTNAVVVCFIIYYYNIVISFTESVINRAAACQAHGGGSKRLLCKYALTNDIDNGVVRRYDCCFCCCCAVPTRGPTRLLSLLRGEGDAPTLDDAAAIYELPPPRVVSASEFSRLIAVRRPKTSRNQMWVAGKKELSATRFEIGLPPFYVRVRRQTLVRDGRIL